jgi:hypothetical protein
MRVEYINYNNEKDRGDYFMQEVKCGWWRLYYSNSKNSTNPSDVYILIILSN